MNESFRPIPLMRWWLDAYIIWSSENGAIGVTDVSVGTNQSINGCSSAFGLVYSWVSNYGNLWQSSFDLVASDIVEVVLEWLIFSLSFTRSQCSLLLNQYNSESIVSGNQPNSNGKNLPSGWYFCLWLLSVVSHKDLTYETSLILRNLKSLLTHFWQRWTPRQSLGAPGRAYCVSLFVVLECIFS